MIVEITKQKKRGKPTAQWNRHHRQRARSFFLKKRSAVAVCVKRQLYQKKSVVKRSITKKSKLMVGADSGAYYTGSGLFFYLKKGVVKRSSTKNRKTKENDPNAEL